MQARGRPKKYRIVRIDPRIRQFSPRGKPGRPEECILTVDEFEAIRLADLTNLCQKDAAKSMRVSQQTFSRILKRARRIVADTLVYGKIIRIQGGIFALSTRHNIPAEPLLSQNEATNSMHISQYPSKPLAATTVSSK
jgi:predicted DNA-binding protein (UPF0251 family)